MLFALSISEELLIETLIAKACFELIKIIDI